MHNVSRTALLLTATRRETRVQTHCELLLVMIITNDVNCRFSTSSRIMNRRRLSAVDAPGPTPSALRRRPAFAPVGGAAVQQRHMSHGVWHLPHLQGLDEVGAERVVQGAG